MKFCGLLMAAGSSQRFGGDKLMSRLPSGKRVWEVAYRQLAAHCDLVIVVVAPGREGDFDAAHVVAGGDSRTASVRNGLAAIPDGYDAVLIHDGARPFVPSRVIEDVKAATEQHGAAYPAIPVRDTIRTAEAELDRRTLHAVQTPQGARLDWLQDAYARAQGEFTDDIAVLRAAGYDAFRTEGDQANIKITYAGDLNVPNETRTGLGYDIHRMSDDASRPMWLGGVELPGPGLDGHSDADAPLHALTDAILGAIGQGDIGEHFPPTDPQWKNCPSSRFLTDAVRRANAEGFDIVNADLTIVAEAPKIGPHRPAMQKAIGDAMGISPQRVSIKATTNELLGAIGRREGIAAFAIVTLIRPVCSDVE